MNNDKRGHLSRTIESLLDTDDRRCDVLIVGSGYGGSFAAAELAHPDNKVWVLERGREYLTGEFPETLDQVPSHIQYWRDNDKLPIGTPDGLLDFRVDQDCAALIGCGLGGGSLINAGVLAAPEREVFGPRSEWPGTIRDDPSVVTGLFGEVRERLGARPFDGARQFPKYKALQRIAASLPGARCEPADIAVTQRQGPNSVGVIQQPCVKCGNCVTGCNFGAKNTLTMNMLPLAVSRSASCFTGAQVVEVVPIGQAPRPHPKFTDNHRPVRWMVKIVRTAVARDRNLAEVYSLYAAQVILAAGTLGSTEILLRSSKLQLSGALGRRVSGNGGFLGFGFGQSDPVSAIASLAEVQAAEAGAPAQSDTASLHNNELRADFKPIGPTILGIVRFSGDGAALPATTVLEDGAIPLAMAPFMNTLGTTLAMAYRYRRDELPRFYTDREGQGPVDETWHGLFKRFRSPDPIALHPEANNHFQVVLGACADRGYGTMHLESVKDGPFERVRMSLPFGKNDKGINGIHDALQRAEADRFPSPAGGFDGGYYLPNPLWKTYPEGSEEVLGTTTSRVVTVHPLGGCVMGDDCRNGVVDHLGRVFNAHGSDPAALYDGLRVLDGSIVPKPLGTNPMLTISALALRSARQLAGELGLPAGPGVMRTVDPAFAQYRAVARLSVTRPRDPTIAVQEVLHTRSVDTPDPVEQSESGAERRSGSRRPIGDPWKSLDSARKTQWHTMISAAIDAAMKEATDATSSPPVAQDIATVATHDGSQVAARRLFSLLESGGGQVSPFDSVPPPIWNNGCANLPRVGADRQSWPFRDLRAESA